MRILLTFTSLIAFVACLPESGKRPEPSLSPVVATTATVTVQETQTPDAKDPTPLSTSTPSNHPSQTQTTPLSDLRSTVSSVNTPTSVAPVPRPTEPPVLSPTSTPASVLVRSPTPTLVSTSTPSPTPTSTPIPIYQLEFEKLVGNFSDEDREILGKLVEDGDLSDQDRVWLHRLNEYTGKVRTAVVSSPMTIDGSITEPELEFLSTVDQFHPDLVVATVSKVESPQAQSFSGDFVLSSGELTALQTAQSLFGLPEFYEGWPLWDLTLSETQALLSILTYYDPFTTLHELRADPADPDSDGAEIFRTLDEHGVFPGECVYCHGQVYPWQDGFWPADEYDELVISVGLHRRYRLIHLAHAAAVQHRSLSPCDAGNFSAVDVNALGYVNAIGGAHDVDTGFSEEFPLVVAGVRLTQDLIEYSQFDTSSGRPHILLDFREFRSPRYAEVGEVLSPFTVGAGILENMEGPKTCLRLMKAIFEWSAKRHDHYLGRGDGRQKMYWRIFPENPIVPPPWAELLHYETARKNGMTVALLRSMNIPSIFGAIFNQGIDFKFQYRALDTGEPLRDHKSGLQLTAPVEIIMPYHRKFNHHNYAYGWAYGYDSRDFWPQDIPEYCHFENRDQPKFYIRTDIGIPVVYMICKPVQ